MIRKIILFVFAISLFNCLGAEALELDYFYRGIRPLGMGDAFTAIADDKNAAFYNPSGLNSVKRGRLEVLPVLVEYSQNSKEFVSDLGKIDENDVQGTMDVMRKHIGKYQHVRALVFPNYTRHNLEIGAFASGKLNAEIHQPSYPYLDVNGGFDTGGVLALAKGFDHKQNRLQVGITGLYVQRRGVNRQYTAVDLTKNNYDFQDDLKTGSSFGFNLGMIYTFNEVAWKPSVALAVQNVGDMDFGNSVGKVKQAVNFGVAFHKTIASMPAVFALDYKDIAGSLGDDKDKGKRLHVGAEIRPFKMLALRGGLNQGYGTFGLELNLWVIQLSYARYTEEVGAYAGQKKDERHVFELIVGW